MSKVENEYKLEQDVGSKEKVFVLFYASWCPFSQRFLPLFQKFAKDKTRACLQIVTDDKANLCERYSVEVVPTVLFFKNGRVVKRLDGAPGKGLNEKQLKEFAESCSTTTTPVNE